MQYTFLLRTNITHILLQFTDLKEAKAAEERRKFPLEERLKQFIIGQEGAINTVAAGLYSIFNAKCLLFLSNLICTIYYYLFSFSDFCFVFFTLLSSFCGLCPMLPVSLNGSFLIYPFNFLLTFTFLSDTYVIH